MGDQLMRVFTLLTVLLLPTVAIAEPVVTAVSGAVVHNEVITVTGSGGFGVKSSAAPLKWDPVGGMYTGLSDGSPVPVGGSNPWPEAPEMEYTSSGAVGYGTTNLRGKTTAHYSNRWVGPTGKANLGGTLFSAPGYFYVTYWIWANGSMCNAAVSDKYLRLTSDAGWNSNSSYAIWPTHGVVTGNNINSGSQEFWNGYCGVTNTWQRMEIWVDNSSAGRTWVYANNSPIGSLPLVPSPALTRTIQGVYTIGFDASQDVGSQPLVDFGEIYVDNTLARVEICNDSNKSDATHCEIQIPQTSWTDTSLQVKVNQGSFADGSDAYLYVIDSDGAVSNAQSITFGGVDPGPAPTTTPSKSPGRYTATQQLSLTASAGTTKYCFGAGCTPTDTYSAPLRVPAMNTARSTVRVQSVNGSNEETVQELVFLKQRRK